MSETFSSVLVYAFIEINARFRVRKKSNDIGLNRYAQHGLEDGVGAFSAAVCFAVLEME